MQVEKERIVSIEYTLTDPAGEVLDTSQGRGPLNYLHGTGGLIPGLEQHLEGREKGDHSTVTVDPKDAYGEKNEELIQPVPRDAFRGVDKIEPGMRFQVQGQGGAARVVQVVKVEPDSVTIDANHPLAGVPLTFDVTVVDVRDATAEELDHGHAH